MLSQESTHVHFPWSCLLTKPAVLMQSAFSPGPQDRFCAAILGQHVHQHSYFLSGSIINFLFLLDRSTFNDLKNHLECFLKRMISTFSPWILIEEVWREAQEYEFVQSHPGRYRISLTLIFIPIIIHRLFSILLLAHPQESGTFKKNSLKY